MLLVQVLHPGELVSHVKNKEGYNENFETNTETYLFAAWMFLRRYYVVYVYD
jgi:hypothetical protein